MPEAFALFLPYFNKTTRLKAPLGENEILTAKARALTNDLREGVKVQLTSGITSTNKFKSKLVDDPKETLMAPVSCFVTVQDFSDEVIASIRETVNKTELAIKSYLADKFRHSVIMDKGQEAIYYMLDPSNIRSSPYCLLNRPYRVTITSGRQGSRQKVAIQVDGKMKEFSAFTYALFPYKEDIYVDAVNFVDKLENALQGQLGGTTPQVDEVAQVALPEESVEEEVVQEVADELPTPEHTPVVPLLPHQEPPAYRPENLTIDYAAKYFELLEKYDALRERYVKRVEQENTAMGSQINKLLDSMKKD